MHAGSPHIATLAPRAISPSSIAVLIAAEKLRPHDATHSLTGRLASRRLAQKSAEWTTCDANQLPPLTEPRKPTCSHAPSTEASARPIPIDAVIARWPPPLIVSATRGRTPTDAPNPSADATSGSTTPNPDQLPRPTGCIGGGEGGGEGGRSTTQAV